MAGSFFSTVDGKSWQAGTGLSTTTQPVYFDPNGQIVYALVNSKLFRSANNGAIFSLMKTFPTPLTAINMVKRDSKTIWLGGSDGTVWHTNDANNGIGATWVKTSVPGAPNNQGASGIAVDPSNTSKGVVIYTPGRAFSTTNNGATWTDITGTLRNLRVNAVVIDPNTSPHAVIVATSTGVMLTTNGATWTVLGKGLPNVLCTSLAIDSTAVPSLLRVGTYGRSAFELSYDRKYVDSQNFGELDGSPEHPFRTVMQALNAPANGAARSISIQAGGYHESPLTIRQCTTLNALNGEAAIQ
jgi:hypothetical protein